MKHSVLLALPLVALCASAQEPVARAPAAQPAAPRPVRRVLPSEAFTTPSNFVVLVNYPGAVDQTWLEGQAAAMQRSLMVGVKAVSTDAVFPEEEGPPSYPDRAEALAMMTLHKDWKIVVLLANPADDDPIPPVLASPYENWVIMDAGWVKRGGGDAAVLADRMGKRIYQALGACCGAAYHPEREAVMRYSPTPASLDDCLSHNFHPLNSNAFSIVARATGLDPVRLRPGKELMEMGLLQPHVPPAAATNAPPAAAADQPFVK